MKKQITQGIALLALGLSLTTYTNAAGFKLASSLLPNTSVSIFGSFSNPTVYTYKATEGFKDRLSSTGTVKYQVLYGADVVYLATDNFNFGLGGSYLKYTEGKVASSEQDLKTDITLHHYFEGNMKAGYLKAEAFLNQFDEEGNFTLYLDGALGLAYNTIKDKGAQYVNNDHNYWNLYAHLGLNLTLSNFFVGIGYFTNSFSEVYENTKTKTALSTLPSKTFYNVDNSSLFVKIGVNF